MDFELSHVLETKKEYGLVDDSKCLKVQANSKQLRYRWVEDLTQAQKRVAVAVPEKGMRVDYEPRPSFFQPSSFVDRQRETVSSTELEDLTSAPRVSDGSGDVLGSNSSLLLSAMLQRLRSDVALLVSPAAAALWRQLWHTISDSAIALQR